MNNKKSFLLLEVVLTIVILSLGLVFIIRAINTCLNISRASVYYSQAINMAYGKLFELEIISQNNGLTPCSIEGKFNEYNNLYFRYGIKKLEDGNLGILSLDIIYRERNKTKGFYIETYVRTI
jgi:hypothetical protein